MRIASAGTGPANTAAPSISGSTKVGSTLTVNPGTWSGTAPIAFAYQWTICDNKGAACHDISGATGNTYVVKSGDEGNTIRVRVTAKNAAGSTAATTAASASLGAAAPPSAACGSSAASAQVVPIVEVSPPVRLQVSQFFVTTGPLKMSSSSFSARFRIADTCGHPVSGALVDAAAVPFNQFTGPRNVSTDGTGWATLHFDRRAGFPASPKQRLLAMFIRAHKAGDPVLAGVSTRRLISFRISR
jgi:hypothetical protein